jgi:hypothetical protein
MGRSSDGGLSDRPNQGYIPKFDQIHIVQLLQYIFKASICSIHIYINKYLDLQMLKINCLFWAVFYSAAH